MDSMIQFWDFDSFLAMGMGNLMLCIVIAIVLLIANWKIFEKAWEEGRKSLIPFYNMYIYYKIAGQKKLFWIFALPFFIGGIWFVLSLVFFFLQGDAAIKRFIFRGLGMLTPFSAMASLIAHCIVQIKMAENFGKSTGFWIGLIFLSGIFIPILGFWSAQYQGDKKTVSSEEKRDEEPTVL